MTKQVVHEPAPLVEGRNKERQRRSKVFIQKILSASDNNKLIDALVSSLCELEVTTEAHASAVYQRA
jgi:hypothetical protein